jgi:type IV secretory pathway VirB10-like protein
MANFHVHLRGHSLLERVLLGTTALAVVVLLFFFLAAMLVVGTIAAIAFLARFWWLKRSLKQPEQPETITAEYTVIEREPQEQARLPDEVQPGASTDGTDPGHHGPSLSAPGPGSGTPGNRAGGS